VEISYYDLTIDRPVSKYWVVTIKGHIKLAECSFRETIAAATFSSIADLGQIVARLKNDIALELSMVKSEGNK